MKKTFEESKVDSEADGRGIVTHDEASEMDDKSDVQNLTRLPKIMMGITINLQIHHRLIWRRRVWLW